MTVAEAVQVITATTGLITASGIIVVAVIQKRQANTLMQVEKQGNSVSLELKRTNMVFSRRTAVATKDQADVALADDAERVYEEARASAERDSKVL